MEAVLAADKYYTGRCYVGATGCFLIFTASSRPGEISGLLTRL